MTATSHVPGTIPVLPGMGLSGRYLLSEEPPATKGDTLDALPLPGRKVGLFVADVVGSGPEAGVAVEHVRAILRERLGAGAGLLGALESLDRYAHSNPEVCAATVCAATLGLADGVLEWTTVGHPPPLHLGASGASYLHSTPTRPLGTGARLVTHTTRLDVGDTVILYTDGLITSEGRDLAAGRRQLSDAARDARAGALTRGSASEQSDAIGDSVLRSMVPPQGSDDDAVILTATRSRPAEPLTVRVDPAPENLHHVRRVVNAWVDGLGAGLVDHVGLGHAVVELAANVIEHAYLDCEPPQDGLRLDGRLDDDGTVSITVSDQGQWREQESGGRGLMMASGLADTMRMSRSSRGTKVQLTQRLARPVPIVHAVPADLMERTLDESGELEIHADPGTLVASGPLDELAADLLHAGLSRATRAGTRDAVINLDAVTHLGSPSLQTIFDFVARSARTGTHLTLRAGSATPAAQVLELAGLPVRS